MRISHKFLKQHATFQDSRCFIPKPPPRLGLQTSVHASFAPIAFVEYPFHRKASHLWFAIWITFFDRMKWEHQNFVMLMSTEEIYCTFPAYDSDLAVQDWILSVILSVRALQSLLDVSFVEIKGIPRYLTGNFPLLKPILASIAMMIASFKPVQKNSVFSHLTSSRELIELIKHLFHCIKGS